MLLPGVLTSFAALLGIVTLASASPGSGPGPHRDVSGGRASTNAMRMANGLAPLRPRRLYDASRTRALRPRSSGSTQTTEYVAAGPASGTYNTRKRSSVPGYFTVSGGVLQYTTNQADAAGFFWTDDTESTLGWVSTETVTSMGIVEGTSYDMYAQLNGEIYDIYVGPVPTGAIATIFNEDGSEGSLNPYLPPAGSTSSQQFLWVMDGSGNMILAPDYATAVNALGDSATIMLTQTYTAGQTPSLAAASAAQEAQLVNPVRLYARNALGTVAGYMGLANSNILWLTASPGTFYVPSLGNGASSQEVLTVKSSQTLTFIGTGSAGALGLQVAQANATTGPIVEFDIPATETGIISLSSGGTALSLYYQTQPASPAYMYLWACDNAADCNTASPGTQELCLEVGPSGDLASACKVWAEEQLASSFVDGSVLYVYDPTGTYSGYLSFDLDIAQDTASITVTTLLANATQVFLNSSTSGQATQQLYSYPTSFVFTWEAYPADETNDGSAFIQAAILNDAQLQKGLFNIPSDPSTGGVITMYPSTYVDTAPTTTVWPFYVSDQYGFPSFYACQTAAECTTNVPGSYEVCVEMVPIGGSPGACAAAASG